MGAGDLVLTPCRPTCLFLAAKTTNYPVPIDVFVQKIAKLQPADVLDTEFLVAQSLAFEFWVRGAEKALRGWGLEFQVSAAGVGEGSGGARGGIYARQLPWRPCGTFGTMRAESMSGQPVKRVQAIDRRYRCSPCSCRYAGLDLDLELVLTSSRRNNLPPIPT
jgi:hypothetical protein